MFPDEFGFEWEIYSQLRPEFETWFGLWMSPHLHPKDWKGKTFLDVGSGMGRNSYWPMTYGAAGGWAIDVSEKCLASTKMTLASFPAVQVFLMSAYNIPVKDRFDIVFSIGVIHHLEFPHQALQKMVAACKPGGKIIIHVYGYENNKWIVWFIRPLCKAIFNHLHIKLLHKISIIPASMLWVFLRCGLGRLRFYQLLKTFSFNHVRQVVFDQLFPRIASYYRRDEVIHLMEHAGLTNIKIQCVNQVSWSAAGTKPTK